MKTISIHRRGKKRPLLSHIMHASNLVQRVRGLLGRPALKAGEGILLSPCGSIHTFGMRYPLDVVFLDKNGRALKCITGLRPARVAQAWGARHTLELGAGTLATTRIRCGDMLTWDESKSNGTRAASVQGVMGVLAVVVLSACATTPAPRTDNFALLRAADTAYQHGDLPRAEAWYRKVIAAVPKDARAYFKLGNLLARQTRLDEAARNYREALIRDPKMAKAYHNLAMVRLLQAEFAFEASLRFLPNTSPLVPQAKRMHRAVRTITYLPVKEFSSSRKTTTGAVTPKTGTGNTNRATKTRRVTN